MTAGLPDSALELRSTVTSLGTLDLSLHDVPVPTPATNEVLVRVEASPINPSDLGVLIAGADMTTATMEGTPERPVVTASLGAGALAGLSARIENPLPVGNEGAGTVVAAGSSPAAQALLGRRVGIAGGAMYTQYRVVDAAACLVLPSGATAKDGASSFVNPLTALGMLETMRREGHSALVHTAAASNLGQMLCQALSKGRGAAGQYHPQARAGGTAALARCGPRLQHSITDVYDRSRGSSQSDVRDDCIRRHRWRNAGKSDPQRYGRSGQLNRGGILTLWVDRPQAGVHLRRTRHGSNHAHQELRHGVGDWRVAAHAVPSERWGRGDRSAPRPCGRRADHDVRQCLHPRGVTRRHAPPRCIQRVRQAGDRGEVPRDSAGARVTASSVAIFPGV